MKYFALTLLIYSGAISACIIGPEKITIDASSDFKIISKKSELCEQCSIVTISAPKAYKNKPFAHGLFTVYSGGELISRSIHTKLNDLGVPEFIGIVSNKKNVSYNITFLYGKGRCKAYEFIYKTP